MAVQPPDMKPMNVEIISVKGECSAGHKVGETLQIGCWDTGGLCGFFYHDIFPNLNVMQFGGKYPWSSGDELILECPDRDNAVTVKIKRS